MGQLDVRQLAAVVTTMAVYVCSSTGPLHVASAVGTATVSPFCPPPPLNATIWGNMGAPSRVIEPENCPRRSGESTCCNFLGQISADQLTKRDQNSAGGEQLACRVSQNFTEVVCDLHRIEIGKNPLFDVWRDKLHIRREVNLRLAVATGFHFAEGNIAEINDSDTGCIREMSWP